MKTRIILMLIALLSGVGSTLKAQPEQLNLPGDNLNLYAVMKIFQESPTLEEFEKTLNEQDARINNLDLDGDNYIDYIKVVDYVEHNVHYIVLQVAVTPSENQDVAVFVVRKDPDGKVVIQLIGDEDLYGKYYIVEPYYDTDPGSTPNPGYYGNYGRPQPQTVFVRHTTYYEVAEWPLIRFIFLPHYIAWHSPWYWGYYPPFWHSWRPWYWHQYYGYHYYWYHHHYAGHFHYGHHYRHDGWHDNYYGHHRAISATVKVRKDRGDYGTTYSRPETLKDGAAAFKMKNPDIAVRDIKEPEIADIRKADRMDNPAERAKVQEKANVRMNDKPSIDNRRDKPENRSGDARPATTGKSQGEVRTNKKEESRGSTGSAGKENRQGDVKTNRPEERSGDVRREKPENRQGNVKTGKQENKSQVPGPEKSTKVEKSEKKSTEKSPAVEKSRQGREGAKKENPKSSGGSDKTGRK